MKEDEIEIAIEKLIGWANQKGYAVKFGKKYNEEVIFDQKLIKINNAYNRLQQLYTLLHECGHIIEYRNGSTHYFKKYPTANKILKDGRSARSLVGRVEVIEEEINAWRSGEKLAEKLQIEIDPTKYNKEAATWIMGYIKWASK